jgi:hypothetical protein
MHAAAAAGAGEELQDGSDSSSGSDSGREAAPEQQQQQQQPPLVNGVGAAGAAAAANQQESNGSTSAAAAAAPAAPATAAAAKGGEGSDEEDASARELAAAKDEAERAEISALLAEENVAELPYDGGDAAAALLKELDSLTGCPRADDVLMYAVPVCGPYAALANYKFKVKLTPGTLKKGKAAKQAVELLVRGGEVLPRERDLMRAVPDAEVVACMVGTVKISASGLQQLKLASKKAKKAAAQSRNAAS